MNGARVSPAQVAQYELEIEIDAGRERVWRALLEETNSWWLPDFHMVDAQSVVTFDTGPGGSLIEQVPGGGSLKWYDVQYFLPDQFKIYLVGHMAPEWGGPSTSSLSLAIDERDGGCVLKVTDAHFGNVTEASVESLSNGWRQLFGEGLKPFVESS